MKVSIFRWVLRACGAGVERGYAGLSSLLRAKREPEKHQLLAPVRGVRALLRWAKFSFAHQKRTRKVPATFEAREARIKGCSPLIIPKGLSKPKNASRFAKRIFWASPVYGSADGVTLSQNFTFSKGVKSAAKQQIGETRKKRLAKRLAFFRFDFSFGV